MEYDLHLEWFRQRLSKLFAIPELEYVDVLVNDNLDGLKRFFDGDFASPHLEKKQSLEVRILYVYRTYYDRLVEKEIVVLEEVPHVQPSEPEPTKEKRKKGRGGGVAAGNKEKRANRGDLKDEDAEVKLDRDFLLGAGGDNATTTVGNDEDGDGKRRKSRRGGKKNKDLDPDVIIETQEFDYIEVKRIVQNYVKTPILNLFFGAVPQEHWDKNVNYYYFVRRHNSPVDFYESMEECTAEITQHIMVGSFRGSHVQRLQSVVANVYKDAAQFQFRDLATVEKNDSNHWGDGGKDERCRNGLSVIAEDEWEAAKDKRDTTQQIEVVDFTRPSDFRSKAVSAKRAGFCATGNDSNLESTRKLSLTPPSINDDCGHNRESCSPQSRSKSGGDRSRMTTIVSRAGDHYFDNLSVNNAEHVEHQKHLIRQRNLRNPIYHRLNENVLSNLEETLQWTISHIELPFTWPTEYNDDGQEHIVFDEDKVKVTVDVQSYQMDDMGRVQLQDIVNGWIKHLKSTIRELQERQPNDFTPMAEYELWRTRETKYNILLEQLKHPFVSETIGKLASYAQGNMNDDGAPSLGEQWKACVDEMRENYVVANENYKYLGTLQEFLLGIREQTDFQIILSILPNLMVGLRNIWSMSNYFCVDANMMMLLRKISFMFTEKIKDIMGLQRLFAADAQTQSVYDCATKCTHLLKDWKRAYVQTRALIEQLGVSSRWEFDKAVLFEDVDHIARICQDIVQVAEIIIEFENMFSANLKSIITDPEEVENIMKMVYSLVQLITCIDYDLFRSGNLENWMATIDLFKRKISQVESHGLTVLDHCIESLRSAEQGLELIDQMNTLVTRQSFRDHVKQKHAGVTKKFLTEISFVENVFMRQKNKLTLQRGEPIHSGSIYWERLLFHHLKKSVIAFRKVEADPCFQNSYLKEQAFSQYFKLVKEMQTFEREKFDSFEIDAIYQINSVIKGNILRLAFVNDNQFPANAITRTIIRRKAPTTATKLIKSDCKSAEARGKFAKTVSNLKWLLNRKTAFDNNTTRAKLYLTGAEKALSKQQRGFNCRDSAKTAQAKLMLQASNQDRIPTWSELIGDQVLSEYNLRFEVNFPVEVFNTVSEAQQFEKHGFRISPALRMSILRKEQLFEDATSVLEMINSYNRTVEGLSLVKIHFLRELLNEVETVIQSGLGRLTWQTFNIKSYCKKCDTLVKKLAASVYQIGYFDKIISQIIAEVEAVTLILLPGPAIGASTSCGPLNLISDIALAATAAPDNWETRKSSLRKHPSPSTHDSSRKSSKRDSRTVIIVEPDMIVSCDEYFATLQEVRSHRMAKLKTQYESIGPLLIKLESLVLGGTATGDSCKMRLYYQHWETATFHGLVRLVRNNLNKFIDALNGEEPLFQIDAQLMLPEIILRPTPTDIYEIIFQSVKDFLESIRALRRWQPGSCIYYEDIHQHKKKKNAVDSDLPSFVDDILGNETVQHLLVKIQGKVHELLQKSKKCLVRWNKYRNIWSFDKVAICERFVNKGLPLIRLDEKFLYYMHVILELENHKPYHDVLAIRINLRPLLRNIIDHAMEWKNTLGNILAEKTKINLLDLQMELKQLRFNLDRSIRGLIDFKVVLQTISNIQSLTISVEIKIKEIQETYNVLEEHQLKFPFEDLLLAYDLEKRWNRLFKSALQRNQSLQVVKSKFAKMTSKEVDVFNAKLGEFMETFRVAGPGAANVEMDRGLALIEPYSEKLDYYEAQRLDLINAEQLFDMELTDYTEFNLVKQEFDYLKIIYKLYRQQQNARRNWAKTLWCNLNAATLTEGIDNYLSEFNKFTAAVRGIPAGRMLHQRMEDFRDSVPIILLLKDAALRKRHWEYLMDCTKKEFEWHPDGGFLLREIFEMELHRFKTEVEGIIQKAIMELAIEETVTDIVSTWDATAFVVLKYHKAGRGTEALETRRSVGGSREDSQLSEQNNRPNNTGNRKDAQDKATESVTVPVDDEVVATTAGDVNEGGGKDKQEVNYLEDGCGDLKSDSQFCFILGSTEEINQTLESHCIQLQSMAHGEHVGPFLESIQAWERNLSLVSEVIEEWMGTQQKYLYLDGIFSEDEIRTQLAAEISQFRKIDTKYRQLMGEVVQHQNVYRVCLAENRLRDLRELYAGLDELQKLLKNFLQTKRQKCTRLFFISDEELLEVLGRGTDPRAIQPHLPKMFDRLSNILQSTDGQQVTGLETTDGEHLLFRVPVSVAVHRPLEVWVNEVIQEMRNSMRGTIKQAVFEYGRDVDQFTIWSREEWARRFTTVAILTASSIWWTLEVEEVFLRMRSGNSRAMKELLATQNHGLDETLRRIRGTEGCPVMVCQLERLKWRTISTADIQRRDYVEQFVELGVSSALDFEWDRQLRFYWLKEFDNVVVVQCSSRIMFGYEFIGIPGKLIVTSLTERVWLTITQALAANLNCCLIGPASVGKTETVKELARTLGAVCHVVNCHKQTDYVTCLAGLLAGCVQSGTWCCLDDLQKVSQSTMSRLATSIQQLRTALLTRRQHVQIDGSELQLNRKFGIFVTVNSDSSDNYSPLLDSLNLLFRPICCPEPDVQHISMVSLTASGFIHARPLAQKLSVLYRLAKEQLFEHPHYSFGLGSMVKVLQVAGEMRLDKTYKTFTEHSIVVRVLSLVHLPSLLQADSQLFKSLLKDLFPGVDCIMPAYEKLRQAITQLTSDSLDYVTVGSQEAKIIELHEVMSVNRATILLGATGSGKSSVLDLMIRSRNELAKEDGLQFTRRITLNPKECEIEQLLGYYEEGAKIWHDGLFSSILRESCQSENNDEDVIIHLDGNMDASWTETLNTVLDNNRVLMLANGERIYMPSNNQCSLLFEVSDLSNVSPATIARCGLVYCDITALGYQPYWTRWLRQGWLCHEKRVRRKVQKLFKSLLVPCVEFVIQGGTLNFHRIQIKSVITRNELGYVRQFCEIFSLLLDLQPPFGTAHQQHQPSVEARKIAVVEELSNVNNIDGPEKGEEDEHEEMKNHSNTERVEVNDLGVSMCATSPNKGFDEATSASITTTSTSEERVDEAVVECLFIQALYASCGALIASPADRAYFDEFIKGRLEDRSIVQDNEASPATATEIPSAYPTLYDYCFDKRSKKWVAWQWLARRQPEHHLVGGSGGKSPKQKDETNNGNDKLAVYDVHVPTRDTLRMNFYLSLCNRIAMWPVLLLGPGATGKTSLVNHYLRQMKPPNNVLVRMDFSRRTTASYVKECIENVLVKRTKTSYGPPVGKRITVFIDDLHMAKSDRYGSQQAIAFLKALIETKGYYDMDKHFKWKHLEDLNFIAAMGSALGVRYTMDERFLARVFTFLVPDPDDDSLRDIYTTLLTGHLSSFSDKVKICTAPLVGIMLNVFRRLQDELTSTPKNSHYVFNMKDLSRVCFGIMQTHGDYCKLPRHLFRLWRNEFTRTIADRLTCKKDMETLNAIISTEMSHNFCSKFQGVADREEVDNGEEMNCNFFTQDTKEISFREYVMREPLLYGDYRNAMGNARESRAYEDLLDYGAIYFLFQEMLDEYNAGNRLKKLTIVLFEYCLEHLTRIHRVLRMYRGHMLLVGPSACGKKTLCELAAFAANRELCEINVIASTYDLAGFERKLKEVLIKAGLRRSKVVLLLNLDQVVDERFLELVNNLLTFGRVPFLFSTEEVDQVIELISSAEDEEWPIWTGGGGSVGTPDCRAAKWDYFERACMQNLNIVLTISSCSEKGNRTLRGYCRNFPGLLGHTTINWMSAWPMEAWACISKAFLGEHPKIPEQHRESVIAHTVLVHETVQHYSKELLSKYRQVNYVTPKHFLGYIMTFLDLIVRQERTSEERRGRLQEGINKLDAAVHQIGHQLSITVEEHRKNVSAATVKYEEISQRINDIERDKKVHEEKRYEKSIEVDQKTKQIGLERNAVDQILTISLPGALEKAGFALKSVTLKDIEVEIINNNPVPEAIQVIMECVLVLRGDTDTSWSHGKALLVEEGATIGTSPTPSLNLFTELERINLETITSKQLSTIRAALKRCGQIDDSFLDEATGGNRVGRALYLLLQTAQFYGEAMRDVRAKRERLEYFQHELESQIKVLTKINEDYVSLNAELQRCHIEHTSAISEKQRLIEMLEQSEKRVETSQKLMERFDERDLWMEQLELLEERIGLIPGDCLLGAAFLNYCGPFPQSLRRQLMETNWLEDINRRGVPHSCPFDVKTLLCDERQINWWFLNGLPQGDVFFVENAILVEDVVHFPLVIDPHKLALSWIEMQALHESHGKKELTVTNFMDPSFEDKLRVALEEGQWIMFNDVEEVIDNSIATLFNDWLCDRTVVMWRGRETAVHPKFRIFMRTEVSHPKLDASVFGFATVITFTVTEVALVDMFRGLILKETTIEHAESDGDLEYQYQMAQRGLFERQNKRIAAEEKLMDILCSADGNLLDSLVVVEQLETVKEELRVIENELADCKELQSDMSKNRQVDKNDTLAKTATCLFFVLYNFKSVHSWYESSLDSFSDVLRSITRTMASGGITNRLQLANVETELVWQVFRFGSLTILHQHFIAFVLELAVRLQLLHGQVTASQVDFFINESTVYGTWKCVDKDVVEDQVERNVFGALNGWRNFEKLVEIFPETFSELANDIRRNPDVWREWRRGGSGQKLPHDWDDSAGEVVLQKDQVPRSDKKSLTDFEQLLLLRCFPAENLYNGVEIYIKRVLGERFLTRPVIDLGVILADYGSPWRPILFMQLPQGFDALGLVRSISNRSAESKVVEADCGCSVADQQRLEMTFRQAQKTGSWLLLANCHLSNVTMKRVELWLRQGRDVHANFRLFMTSRMEVGGDNIIQLPVNLLRGSIKVNTEQPKHLKSNLNTLFRHQIDDDMLRFAHSTQTGVEGQTKSAAVTNWISMAQRQFRSILYSLTVFHVMALERRKYGKIGWNLEYRFNETELAICIQMASVVFSKAAKMQQQHHPLAIPWPTIRHMVSEIIYGGHIADKFDRRLVGVYMDEYFSEFLFNDCQRFVFYSSQVFEYKVLDCGSRDEFLGEIERMPSINTPDVAGLHANVAVQYCEDTIRSTWQGLSKLQIRSVTPYENSDSSTNVDGVSATQGTIDGDDNVHSTRRCLGDSKGSNLSVEKEPEIDSGGESEENAVEGKIRSRLTDRQERHLSIAVAVEEDDIWACEKVCQLIKVLPKSYDIEKVRKTFQINITPTGVVLMQELERFNRLVAVVERDLIDLRNTVKKGEQLTLALEMVRDKIMHRDIPKQWRKFAPETSKSLARWFEQLQDRDEQYKFWSLSGEPLIMRLALLHSPQSYITSLVLMACRENNWSLETTTFYTEVTAYQNPDEIEERPKSGCYASDILIEGADWSVADEGSGQDGESKNSGDNSSVKTSQIADGGYLVQAKLRNSINRLPIIRIIPVEMHKLKLQNTVRLPVYTTPHRRGMSSSGSSRLSMSTGPGFVFEADLRTKIHPNHWILQGVCLLLNLD